MVVEEKTDFKILNDEQMVQFSGFLDSPTFTDVTIVVEGKRFQCHRIVLQTSSDFFQRELHRVDPVLKPIFVLDGVQLKPLSTILNFLYTGQAIVDRFGLPELLKAAQYLEITTLAELLLRTLNSPNYEGSPDENFRDDEDEEMVAGEILETIINLDDESKEINEFIVIRKDDQRVVSCDEETELLQNPRSVLICHESNQYQKSSSFIIQSQLSDSCNNQSQISDNCNIKSQTSDNCNIQSQKSDSCNSQSQKLDSCNSQSQKSDNSNNQSEKPGYLPTYSDKSVPPPDQYNPTHTDKFSFFPSHSVQTDLQSSAAPVQSSSDSIQSLTLADQSTLATFEHVDSSEEKDREGSSRSSDRYALPPEQGPQYRKKQSKVWDYFGKTPNGSTVVCGACGFKIKYSSNTTTMARHIKKFHEESSSGMINETEPAHKAVKDESKSTEEPGAANLKSSSRGLTRTMILRSPVWTFFQRIQDKVQCNICRQLLVYSHNTSNLRLHLRTKHKRNLTKPKLLQT